MRTVIALALFVGAVALVPAFALAGSDSRSVEQFAVEKAETPEEHADLERHYRSLAEEARGHVRHHEKMGSSYRIGKLHNRQRMERHCKKIAESYASTAKEYEALADLHKDEARQSE